MFRSVIVGKYGVAVDVNKNPFRHQWNFTLALPFFWLQLSGLVRPRPTVRWWLKFGSRANYRSYRDHNA